MKRFALVHVLLVASALAAPQVSFGEDDDEPTNVIPADELKPKLNQEQLSVRQGTLAGYLNLPPVPNLSTVEKTETTKIEITNIKETNVKSPYAPNGPSNGNCLCVPPQNCAVPAPGPPGSGIGGGGIPPPPPAEVPPGGGSVDGQGLIDIRIVNRPPPNICAPNLVYCCVQKPVLPPILPPPPESLKRCGAPKPQPIPGIELDPTQALFGEFPWMVVILGPNNNYIGGGALIDGRHIITAAHKVAQYAASGALGIKVRLGEWDAKQNTEPLKYVELPIQQIKIHPFFNPANLKNDIAVLRLPEAVNFAAAPHVAPACLPDFAHRYEGRRCWVTGWGKDAFGNGGQFQYILKKVDIPVLNSNDCEARLRSTRLGPIFQLDRTSFVCAGGEPGKDACQGDGGSPIVCEVQPNRFEVVGLVAWGIGCADPGIPGVYVNVASYVDWIIQQVSSP